MVDEGHVRELRGGGDGDRHSPLRGRATELTALTRVLDGARASRGGSLVISGQAGIGKTALIEATEQLAGEFRCLSACGAEFEMGLAFGALDELLKSLHDRIREQRGDGGELLRTALGFGGRGPPNAFQVGAATLALLSEVARGQPVLCLLDDAQWLDSESAQALAFVAQRVADEPIALVFALRDRAERFELARLEQLPVRALPENEARALLLSSVRGPLDDRAREAILAEAEGNPLALLELPHTTSPGALAGGFGLTRAAVVSESLEASFSRRLDELSAATRLLLLVAAAEPLADPLVIWSAAEQLGVTTDDAGPAEMSGLLEFGSRVRFRHPLVRAAVYRSAPANDRRRAHRALARATDRDSDPDRRAWHMGQAALKPDEVVASELNDLAGRAQARGGAAAAAMFLERSAELTPDTATRSRRALLAAQRKYEAGAFDASERLLQMAAAGPPDGHREASVAVVRAQLQLSAVPVKQHLEGLLAAAMALMTSDDGAAREVLLQVLASAMFGEHFAAAPMLPRIADAVRHAPSSADPRPLDLFLDALGAQIVSSPEAGTQMREAVDAFCRRDALDARDIRWFWLVCAIASTLWDDGTWQALSDSQLRALRQAGLLTALPAALSYRAIAHILSGELADAAAVIEEANAIGKAMGAPVVDYAELIVCAFRGNEARILELRDEGPKDGSGRALSSVEYARAVLYNGLGQYERALEAALEVVRRDEPAFRATSPPELIEAAVRAGHPELARSALDQLCARTRLAGTDWAIATELRERALMEDGEDIEELYRGAIAHFSKCRLPIHLARSHLVYGEWLRRHGRRSDARPELRTAHEILVSIGAHTFAARAAGELRATGERPRKRTSSTADELTAQELQVARLVAAGATTKEVAGELFLSPRTVDAHLRSIFRKFGITSRRQLRNMPFGVAQPAPSGASSSGRIGA